MLGDQPQCFFQLCCHIDIGARRFGLAAQVIVNKDHRFGMMPQRDIDHFADIDRRLVDGALRQRFLGNQPFRLSRHSIMKCSIGSCASRVTQ